MNCDKSINLMNQRLDDPSQDAERDWSSLDEHLTNCVECQREWTELTHSIDHLNTLREITPTSDELNQVWNNIFNTDAADHQTPRRRLRTNRGWVVPSSAATLLAACLVAAFLIGQDRYGPIRRQIQSEANLQELGRAMQTYAADDPMETAVTLNTRSLWMLIRSGEVTPKQFICPSSGDQVSATANNDLKHDFDQYDNISYGYENFSASRGITSARVHRQEGQNSSSLSELRSLGYVASSDHGSAQRAEMGANDFVAGEAFTMASPKESELGNAATGLELSQSSAVLGREFIANEPQTVGQEVVEGAPVQAEADPVGGDKVAVAQSKQRKNQATVVTKIITTCELGIEVDDYEASAANVTEIVAAHQCVIADSSASEQDGGSLAGRFVIRVSPQHVTELLNALKTIGQVESESIKAADVTADYVDLDARLKSLRLAEQRLLDLMQSKSIVDRMSALLEVERELTRVRSEIEQYEGRIRVMANRVALATIRLHIHEPVRANPQANLSVEVQRLESAAEALGTALAQRDGVIQSGVVQKSENGALKGEYEIRVPLTQFDSTLRAVDDLGRVTHRTTRGWSPGDVETARADRRIAVLKLILSERRIQLPAGQIGIEIPEHSEATKELSIVAKELGAELVGNTTNQRPDGSSQSSIKLHVPAGQFTKLAARLNELGRTTSRQITGAGGVISGGAADALCTLQVILSEPIRQVPRGDITIEVDQFHATRDKLSGLVEEHGLQVLDASSLQATDGTWVGRFRLGIRAGDLDDMVASFSRWGRVKTRQITGSGLGDLSPTNPQVLGVIDLVLGEKSALSPGVDRAHDSIRQKVRDALAGLYASIGFVIYGLLVLAPWIVLVLLAGWIALRLWRRRTKRIAQQG